MNKIDKEQPLRMILDLWEEPVQKGSRREHENEVHYVTIPGFSKQDLCNLTMRQSDVWLEPGDTDGNSDDDNRNDGDDREDDVFIFSSRFHKKRQKMKK